MGVERINIKDSLKSNYVPYAFEVILSRAIPSIDGFKPSQRKLLYTMYKMGLLKKGKTKSANIVGQTMRLNPHGDQAIYQTMVRMSQGNESLLYPFVASKGNFGKRVSKDMKFAASRYTEAGLAPISELIFSGLQNGEIVPFVDNYDGTMKEPTMLPTRLPFIVLNPSQGVAVGFASSIPSYNLEEVVSYVVKRLRLEEETSAVHKYIKGPDFPTGAKLVNKPEKFREILETGKGAYTLRAKYEFVKNTIEITEIPYTTTIEDIINRVVYFIKKGTLFTEIKDIRDETGLKGLKIAIDVKKGTNVKVLMDQLFTKTTLEDSFHCQFNVLLGGILRETNFIDLIEHWIIHRVKVETKALEIELEGIEFKLHRIMGLSKVELDIDKVIAVIRNTKTRQKVISNLMAEFELSEIQAEYIAEIKLRNLNKEYLLDRQSERDNLETNKRRIERLLGDEELLKEELAKELEEITEKYKLPRKTVLINEEDLLEVDEIEKVDDYNLEAFLTDQGYFKKIKLTSLRGNDDHKTKTGDEVIQRVQGKNTDEILFFTNKAIAYKRQVRELSVCKASELGVYLTNELELANDEKILYMVIFDPRKPEGHMIFTYDNGKIAKVPIESFLTKTNRKYLKNAYSEAAPLVSIYKIVDPTQITIFRKYKTEYRALTLNSEDIPEKKTRSVNGIMAHKQRPGSKCVFSCITEEALEFNLKLSTPRFEGKLNRVGEPLGSSYIPRLNKMRKKKGV